VEAALEPLREQVDRSGGSRGLVAVHSTIGLLKVRLGALPEADAAARIALHVVQEGDFAPGLAFAATVLADVAVASGELSEAQALLDSTEDSLIAADASLAMGKVEYAQRRYKAGDPYFEAGLAMLERLDALEDLTEESAHYAQLLENRNDRSRAIQYWRKAYETRLKMKH